MKTIALSMLGALLALCSHIAPAEAFTRFISMSGNDANPCSSLSPCQTLERALSVALPGDLVQCIDSGRFGFSTVFIDKSITIDCTGHTASVDKLVIQTTDIKVILRGLTITPFASFGSGGPAHGIEFKVAGLLIVENCTINNFFQAAPGAGIYVNSPGASRLYVTDTTINGNGAGNNGGGIVVHPQGSGVAFAWLNRVTMNQNSYGIFAQGLASTGPIIVDVRDTAINGSAFHGVFAITDSSPAAIVLNRTVVSLSGGNGILAQGAGAMVHLGASTVRGNATGLSVTGGGQILSFQNNEVAGNGTDGAPTGVLTLK